MEMFANFRFVQDIARQLIKPRPCNYMALDIWKHISNRELYHYENPNFQIPENRTISLHMIQNTAMKSVQNRLSSTCIVYLHGLSSFSVQGTFLVQNLEKIFSELNLSVCLYDLRGHGKDKGPNVTFGLQQSKQLYQILLFLKNQRKYKHFILWGRSMGATTILKMLNDLHQDIKQNQIQIKYLVLDSAFSSIEKVATEIISRKSRMPQIFCKPLFEYLISTIEKLYKIRLTIDIPNLKSFETNALFLYSQTDNLVSSEHSKILYNKYNGPKDKIQMNVGHNDQRPDSVLIQVFEKLKQSLKLEAVVQQKKLPSTKKIGLSVTKTKKNKTNQSAFDGVESCITEDFYEHRTSESNKENLNDLSNKRQQHSISKVSNQINDQKNLKNKNIIKIEAKIQKIEKDRNIKQLKLTKKFISLNGNMKHSVELLREKQIKSTNVKVFRQKNQQKLKLSHINIDCQKKGEIKQVEPKNNCSIYQKVAYNQLQKEKKDCPQPQVQNGDQSRFKQVKSAFLIRNSCQTVKNISRDTKPAQIRIKHDDDDLIQKKLSLNQPNYDKSTNNYKWTTNHITHPTAKPQSSNVNLTQKRLSILLNPNHSQKELTKNIEQETKKQQIIQCAKKSNLQNMRKSIDQELIKMEKIFPIHQNYVMRINGTALNWSQKVIFNFNSQDQNKTDSIQKLSNMHYM